jgi:nucleoside-diphosphate-sugar epimerase
MSNTDELHVIIGVSGATGSSVAKELLSHGKRVRGVNRSGRAGACSGVEVVRADAADAASMRDACSGAAVVYNCVNPPLAEWREVFPRVMEAVIEGSAAAGAKLVFADDTWMYGKVDGPMTEDLPYRPVSDRGVLRALLAEMLMRAHATGKIRATIGRASELYGPAVRSLLAQNLFTAALKGRIALWVGDRDMPLTPTFIDDFAKVLVTLGARDEALGQVWHVPHPAPTSGREFIRTIFSEAGTSPKMIAVGGTLVGTLGLVSPMARAVAEMAYQFEQPFIVDGSKYLRAFGGDAIATSYRDGIRDTVHWYRTERRRR